MNIQSMTGFGQAEEKGFRVEVRSVNHRFLDLHFRMPVFINPYEITLKNMIKERFARGRFDVSISLTEGADIKIGINKRLAENILRELRELQEALHLKEGPSLDHLFWFRDMLFSEEPEYRLDDLVNAFRAALDRLGEMRLREGEYLVKDILSMVAHLQELIEAVRAEAEGMLAKTYERIRERISELTEDAAIEDTRILQEAAFLAERADISEEIARIQSHVLQIRKIISEGGTIGRNLDFLLQELLREINTIGSKSNEYRISDLVVQMKTVVEKIKEQVQNIQ